MGILIPGASILSVQKSDSFMSLTEQVVFRNKHHKTGY